MVNYLGFTLIKLPNNQRYNKMTILKSFHKKKSTICLLVVAPEIRAWAPWRRKKYNFLSFCGSPFSKDPTNPCPGFSSEFINYYHRFYKPPPPLPSPPLPSVQASVFSLTSFVSDNNILVLTFQKHYV